MLGLRPYGGSPRPALQAGFEILPTRPGAARYKAVDCGACPFAPLGLPEKRDALQLRPTVAKRDSTVLAGHKAVACFAVSQAATRALCPSALDAFRKVATAGGVRTKRSSMQGVGLGRAWLWLCACTPRGPRWGLRCALLPLGLRAHQRSTELTPKSRSRGGIVSLLVVIDERHAKKASRMQLGTIGDASWNPSRWSLGVSPMHLGTIRDALWVHR